MKRNSNISDPHEDRREVIHEITLGTDRAQSRIFRLIKGISRQIGRSGFRKSLITLFFLTFTFSAFAPVNYSLVIAKPPLINPFKPLLYATGMVETMGNTLAYNEFENAAGIFQIRQVRVDDYNRRTGNKYTLADMFDYSISEKVFLYFASLIGPYDLEKIARSWNGSGPMTENYWKRIKAYLN